MSILKPTVIVSQSYFWESDPNVLERLVFIENTVKEVKDIKSLVKKSMFKLRAVKTSGETWVAVIRSGEGFLIKEYSFEMCSPYPVMSMLMEWLSGSFEVKEQYFKYIPDRKSE